MKSKQEKRQLRHKRIRARVKGTPERPRLSVYRSNKNIYAQLIDDNSGLTLAAGDNPRELARKAAEKGIKKVVFDRGGFNYTGRIRRFAEDTREAGLEF